MLNPQLKASKAPTQNNQSRCRLAQWGRACRPFQIAASTLGILQTLFYIGFAWATAQTITNLFDSQMTLGPFLLALSCALLRGLCQAGETQFGFEASAKVRAFVRKSAAEALINQGPQFTQHYNSGELSSILTDSVEKLDGYYGRYQPLQAVLVVSSLAILAASFSQSWVAGLTLLVSMPVFIVLSAIIGGISTTRAKGQLTAMMRLSGQFNDRLRNLVILNAFNAADREGQSLAKSSEAFRKHTMKVLSLAFLSSSTLELVSAFSMAFIALYVGSALLGTPIFNLPHTIDLQAGLFVLILAPEYFMPLRRLSAAYHDHADAKASYDSLAPIFDGYHDNQTPVSAPTTMSQAPRIEFKSVGSLYADNRRGLAPLSFIVEPEQMCAIWGPSGIGKSTTLKLMLGYAPLSEGEIWINNQRLEQPLSGHMAWIGQNPHVFHGTIADNISLFDNAITRQQIESAATISGAMEFIQDLPDGLQTQLGENGAGLSGGQAQRLALARAFAADHKLLLLDEPTAHLDEDTEQNFIKALKSIATGRTILIATHSPNLKKACDMSIDLSRPL